MPNRSKFTQAVRERILEVKGIGGPDTLACAHAGIDNETLRRWLAKGRENEEGMFHDFAVAYDQAKSAPQVRALTLLQKKVPDSDPLLIKYIERQVEGYAPPAMVAPHVQQGPTIIALQFQSGQPATPAWLDAEVIDAPESPALGAGGSDPDTAAGS
jgi:hypothetical protein